MLAKELIDLAQAGAAAVIGAMGTDVWSMAKAQLLRLLRRGDVEYPYPRAQWLDEAALELAQASDHDREQVHQKLLSILFARLAEHLERHPEAKVELQKTIEQIEYSTQASTSFGNVVINVRAQDKAKTPVLGHGQQNITFN